KPTTATAITPTAAASTAKWPRSVASLIAAPSPVVLRMRPLYFMYSATILAFQAPPMAVIQPVSRGGEMDGRIDFGAHACHDHRVNRATSQSSRGIRLAPAMTLNKTYHCVPSINNTTAPNPSPAPAANIAPMTRGKIIGAGKLAAI